MEHHLEKIVHKKRFFIKSFVVSVILLIIACLIGLCCFDYFANMASVMYGVDAEDYGKIHLTFMAFWKLLIIQFTLVPAIVMWLVEKHVKSKEMDE